MKIYSVNYLSVFKYSSNNRNNSNIYKYLSRPTLADSVSFKKLSPDLNKQKEKHCLYCDSIIYSKEELEQITNDTLKLSGDELQKSILSYKDQICVSSNTNLARKRNEINHQKCSFFDDLIQYSKESPESDAKTLILGKLKNTNSKSSYSILYENLSPLLETIEHVIPAHTGHPDALEKSNQHPVCKTCNLDIKKDMSFVEFYKLYPEIKQTMPIDVFQAAVVSSLKLLADIPSDKSISERVQTMIVRKENLDNEIKSYNDDLVKLTNEVLIAIQAKSAVSPDNLMELLQSQRIVSSIQLLSDDDLLIQLQQKRTALIKTYSKIAKIDEIMPENVSGFIQEDSKPTVSKNESIKESLDAILNGISKSSQERTFLVSRAEEFALEVDLLTQKLKKRSEEISADIISNKEKLSEYQGKWSELSSIPEFIALLNKMKYKTYILSKQEILKVKDSSYKRINDSIQRITSAPDKNKKTGTGKKRVVFDKKSSIKLNEYKSRAYALSAEVEGLKDDIAKNQKLYNEIRAKFPDISDLQDEKKKLLLAQSSNPTQDNSSDIQQIETRMKKLREYSASSGLDKKIFKLQTDIYNLERLYERIQIELQST